MRYMNIRKPNKDVKNPKPEPLSIRFSIIARAEQEKRWRSIELERVENAGIASQCQSQLTPSIIPVEARASGHTRALNTPRYYIPNVWPQVFIDTDTLDLVPRVPNPEF